MVPAKVLFVTAFVALCASSASAGLLDYIYPRIIAEYYTLEPTEVGYRFSFKEPNQSEREEIGVIVNPGTENEELVVMGMYKVFDEKSQIETTTMYTADKNGYKTRYMLKNRKLSPGALKSAAG